MVFLTQERSGSLNCLTISHISICSIVDYSTSQYSLTYKERSDVSKPRERAYSTAPLGFLFFFCSRFF